MNLIPSQRDVKNNQTDSIHPNRAHEATQPGNYQMPFPVPSVASLRMLSPEWM